jgi:hypothetical protein
MPAWSVIWPFVRIAGPWALILIVSGAVALFYELGPLRSSERLLSEERREHTETSRELQRVTDANAKAEQEAFARNQEIRSLGLELDSARAELAGAVRDRLNTAGEEIRNATDNRSSVPVTSSWRMCINRADIAGTDRALCGNPTGVDGGATEGAGDMPG